MIDPLGRETDYSFDTDGRVVGTVVGAELASIDEETSSTVFDAFGEVIETIDAKGEKSYDVVDGDGRVTATMELMQRTAIQPVTC